jgi:serine/threonine protein kinase
VAFDGDQNASVGGTPRFMAPEIVRGEAKPSTQTDLFSLSVLLFYMLMVHHPLEGRREAQIRCLDLPAMNKLYGTDPLFIFDPHDHSNAPDPDLHPNAIEFWPIYPGFLQELFVRSFTDGIRDPEHGRVRESEWRSAMVRLNDSVMYCPSCGAENFYDRAKLQATTGSTQTCWSCGRAVIPPPRLRVGRHIVMLNHDTKLFPHHLDEARPFDFSAPVAEVQRHPSQPNTWGLKNLSSEIWVRLTAAGDSREVGPGATVSIAAGTKLRFSSGEGEFRT